MTVCSVCVHMLARVQSTALVYSSIVFEVCLRTALQPIAFPSRSRGQSPFVHSHLWGPRPSRGEKHISWQCVSRALPQTAAWSIAFPGPLTWTALPFANSNEAHVSREVESPPPPPPLTCRLNLVSAIIQVGASGGLLVLKLRQEATIDIRKIYAGLRW